MCKWGTHHRVLVMIPAGLSHTGRRRQAWVQVDSCIADLVQALNVCGIETAGCCCGHGRRRGEIILTDGRVLIISRTNRRKGKNRT